MSKANHSGQFFLEIPKPEQFGHRGGIPLLNHIHCFFAGGQKNMREELDGEFRFPPIFFFGKPVNGYITNTQNNIQYSLRTATGV